jgi:hypothetical protein
MSRPVQRSELLDYQTYSEQRTVIRDEVMRIKAARRVHLGDALTFLFENTATVRYQIQEMMRIEQIVKESAIEHELETYNGILGGEGELGCTLLIEIEDPDERRRRLEHWLDLPRHLYVVLADGTRTPAAYDPGQVGESRLSAVQYLRFATGGRVPTAVGCDHPDLRLETALTDDQQSALREDLAS